MDTKRRWVVSIGVLGWLFSAIAWAGNVKGIYVTQYNLENTTYLNYLIRNAKISGINTFVVDLEIPSKRYQQNIALVRRNGLRYVARIVMFPGGGTSQQVRNPAYWQRKYRLVQQAVAWGANEIQLDYIRYSSKQPPSSDNSKHIHEVIQWFKARLAAQHIPLQIDVFGIASFGESKYIGQNIKLFAQTIDAVCPMVYPSHYVPFAYHYARPHETVYTSLTHIQRQFGGKMPIKMYAYIELSNYHFSMSRGQKLKYIQEQLKAVHEADADGWYAWSPHNRYENLFRLLQSEKRS